MTHLGSAGSTSRAPDPPITGFPARAVLFATVAVLVGPSFVLLLSLHGRRLLSPDRR